MFKLRITPIELGWCGLGWCAPRCVDLANQSVAEVEQSTRAEYSLRSMTVCYVMHMSGGTGVGWAAVDASLVACVTQVDEVTAACQICLETP